MKPVKTALGYLCLAASMIAGGAVVVSAACALLFDALASWLLYEEEPRWNRKRKK